MQTRNGSIFKGIFLCLLPCILVSCSVLDDGEWHPGGARRYFDYPEYEPDSEIRLMYPFRQEEVISDLGLSSEQVKKINALAGVQFKDVPGGAELIALNMQMLKNSKQMPRKEYRKFLTEWNVRCRATLTKYLGGGIGTILTPEQKNRLDEIRIQTKGPALLFYDKDLADRLVITEEQRKKIQETMSTYGIVLQPLRKELEQVVVDRANNPSKESEYAEKQKKILIRMIRMFNDRDQELIGVLNKPQVDEYRRMCGKPIQITWQGISDFGFRFQQVPSPEQKQ